MRKYNEILFTRGEQAPNCKDLDLPELEIGCDKLFYQMIIRSDGKISLCCGDAYGTYTMGDCLYDKLEVIWQNEKYDNLRKKMIQYGRQGIGGICRNCDVIN